MTAYKRPEKRIHRGFFYLNDEVVINSLSAVESGKIDEVVAKVNTAREGGFGGGLGFQGAKVEGAKKATSAFEEEMVRTRTRFSIFEIWYRTLVSEKALGMFSAWGRGALVDVSVGDTIEMEATLSVSPLQTLGMLYLWFADKAKSQGHFFSQKGEELKSTKEAERNFRMLLGDIDADDAEVTIVATPKGDPGPTVAMSLHLDWLIGSLGQLGGKYTVLGQVDRVLDEGDELPVVRLTRDSAPTPLEIDTLKDAVGHFVEPAKVMGIDLEGNLVTIEGPALWLEPIAIYR